MDTLVKLDRPEIASILFHPQVTPRSGPPSGAIDIDTEIGDAVLIGSRLFTADRENPVIIFFHGNGETVVDYDDIGPVYASLGINFLVADYRGYGWSTGIPSASALISDGHAVLANITGWLAGKGFSGKIFVMGRSMGSVPAIELAANSSDNVSGLIIESGFAETVPLVMTLGIDLSSLGIREDECFNNAKKISSVTVPTFILHGQLDTLIPLWQAQKLHAACGAKSKELQIVPGADHNTLLAVAGMLYFQAVKGYVDRVSGSASWRERRKKFKQQERF